MDGHKPERLKRSLGEEGPPPAKRPAGSSPATAQRRAPSAPVGSTHEAKQSDLMATLNGGQRTAPRPADAPKAAADPASDPNVARVNPNWNPRASVRDSLQCVRAQLKELNKKYDELEHLNPDPDTVTAFERRAKLQQRKVKLCRRLEDMSRLTADTKTRGCEAFRAGDFEQAADLFTKAIADYRDGRCNGGAIAPETELAHSELYSNRSAAFYKLHRFEAALRDADLVIKRRPEWSRAHIRRGNALAAIGKRDADGGRLGAAKEAFLRALGLDPMNSTAKQRLRDLEQLATQRLQ